MFSIVIKVVADGAISPTSPGSKTNVFVSMLKRTRYSKLVGKEWARVQCYIAIR